MSDCDFDLDGEIGILLDLDRCIVLGPLCGGIRSEETDVCPSLPIAVALNAPGGMSCRREEMFLDYLEGSSISTGSCHILSPTIDYPSENSGNLGLRRSSIPRRHTADRRTCWNRGQRKAGLVEGNSWCIAIAIICPCDCLDTGVAGGWLFARDGEVEKVERLRRKWASEIWSRAPTLE